MEHTQSAMCGALQASSEAIHGRQPSDVKYAYLHLLNEKKMLLRAYQWHKFHGGKIYKFHLHLSLSHFKDVTSLSQ